MNEKPKFHIPLCWKCANAKVKRDTRDNSFDFIGCEKNSAIKNYSDAEKLCSCLPQNTYIDPRYLDDNVEMGAQ